MMATWILFRLLQNTYEIKSGPAHMSTEQYQAWCRTGWSELLASDPEEADVQYFFEQHPMLLPGAWTPGTKSGHHPFHSFAFSQPRLPGLKTKVPDFMWISSHSLKWYPTLIEIERPSKRLFTKRGIPTSEFNQSRNQLAEWRTWFSKPENLQLFISSYGIDESYRLGRQVELHLILLYGRRNEFLTLQSLSEQRASLLSGQNEELMSFDRLSPDATLDQAITVKALGSGEYEVLHVPPTLELGPHFADRLPHLKGIESALDQNRLISDKRKNFLLSRIPYWREWAKNPGKSVVRGGDRE